MNNLKDFFLALSNDERENFARKCNTSTAYIQQIYQGHRQASAGLAIDIDKYSNGAVKCDGLHPNADFEYLRSQSKETA